MVMSSLSVRARDGLIRHPVDEEVGVLLRVRPVLHHEVLRLAVLVPLLGTVPVVQLLIFAGEPDAFHLRPVQAELQRVMGHLAAVADGAGIQHHPIGGDGLVAVHSVGGDIHGAGGGQRPQTTGQQAEGHHGGHQSALPGTVCSWGRLGLRDVLLFDVADSFGNEFFLHRETPSFCK